MGERIEIISTNTPQKGEIWIRQEFRGYRCTDVKFLRYKERYDDSHIFVEAKDEKNSHDIQVSVFNKMITRDGWSIETSLHEEPLKTFIAKWYD